MDCIAACNCNYVLIVGYDLNYLMGFSQKYLSDYTALVCRHIELNDRISYSVALSLSLANSFFLYPSNIERYATQRQVPML